jgi:integrase/recombinase XerD
MSPLQQRMLEDMQLRGLSARTQEAYARAVWQLAQHNHRRPDQLSDEELRQYFLYLTNEKKIARPTATIALCGIKFFYEQTLKQALAHAALCAPSPGVEVARGAESTLYARGSNKNNSKLTALRKCY